MTPNPRTNSHKDSKGNSMTTIERMARAAEEAADYDYDLPVGAFDRVSNWPEVAKAALAALLPLDEGALKDARAKFEDARRLGWLRSGCGRGAVIRATIKAYLEHIARETEA